MKRLTIDEIIEHCGRKTEMYEKACDVKYLETAVMGNGIKEYWEHKQVAEYLRKLKEYEDLEEQGRLVKLPCKAEDIIYVITPCCKTVEECKVITVNYINTVISRNVFYIEALPTTGSRALIGFYNKEFGKTVFLTKSEAEAKLKELRGNQNGKV